MNKPIRVLVAITAGIFIGALVSAAVDTSAAGAPHAPAAAPLRILEEPEAGMSRIDKLLSSANKSVDLEMYELSDPVIEAILAHDAHRGVDVRVILNAHYTQSENEPAYSYFTSHGVHVHWASSRFDITHEKAAAIDGATALVMTMNFTAEYYSTTRDVVVIDTQPGDVLAITRTFNRDWNGGGYAVHPER